MNERQVKIAVQMFSLRHGISIRDVWSDDLMVWWAKREWDGMRKITREALEMNEPRKPKVKMLGEDGNVFSIIGRVSKALKRDGQEDRAKEWTDMAMKCKSYDAVLQLMFDFVEPS